MAAEPHAPALARVPPRRRQPQVFAAAPAGAWHPEAVVAALRAGHDGTEDWLEFAVYPGSEERTQAMRLVVQLRATARPWWQVAAAIQRSEKAAIELHNLAVALITARLNGAGPGKVLTSYRRHRFGA